MSLPNYEDIVRQMSRSTHPLPPELVTMFVSKNIDDERVTTATSKETGAAGADGADGANERERARQAFQGKFTSICRDIAFKVRTSVMTELQKDPYVKLCTAVIQTRHRAIIRTANAEDRELAHQLIVYEIGCNAQRKAEDASTKTVRSKRRGQGNAMVKLRCKTSLVPVTDYVGTITSLQLVLTVDLQAVSDKIGAETVVRCRHVHQGPVAADLSFVPDVTKLYMLSWVQESLIISLAFVDGTFSRNQVSVAAIAGTFHAITTAEGNPLRVSESVVRAVIAKKQPSTTKNCASDMMLLATGYGILYDYSKTDGADGVSVLDNFVAVDPTALQFAAMASVGCDGQDDGLVLVIDAKHVCNNLGRRGVNIACKTPFGRMAYLGFGLPTGLTTTNYSWIYANFLRIVGKWNTANPSLTIKVAGCMTDNEAALRAAIAEIHGNHVNGDAEDKFDALAETPFTGLCLVHLTEQLLRGISAGASRETDLGRAVLQEFRFLGRDAVDYEDHIASMARLKELFKKVEDCAMTQKGKAAVKACLRNLIVDSWEWCVFFMKDSRRMGSFTTNGIESIHGVMVNKSPYVTLSNRSPIRDLIVFLYQYNSALATYFDRVVFNQIGFVENVPEDATFCAKLLGIAERVFVSKQQVDALEEQASAADLLSVTKADGNIDVLAGTYKLVLKEDNGRERQRFVTIESDCALMKNWRCRYGANENGMLSEDGCLYYQDTYGLCRHVLAVGIYANLNGLKMAVTYHDLHPFHQRAELARMRNIKFERSVVKGSSRGVDRSQGDEIGAVPIVPSEGEQEQGDGGAGELGDDARGELGDDAPGELGDDAGELPPAAPGRPRRKRQQRSARDRKLNGIYAAAKAATEPMAALIRHTAERGLEDVAQNMADEMDNLLESMRKRCMRKLAMSDGDAGPGLMPLSNKRLKSAHELTGNSLYGSTVPRSKHRHKQPGNRPSPLAELTGAAAVAEERRGQQLTAKQLRQREALTLNVLSQDQDQALVAGPMTGADPFESSSEEAAPCTGAAPLGNADGVPKAKGGRRQSVQKRCNTCYMPPRGRGGECLQSTEPVPCVFCDEPDIRHEENHCEKICVCLTCGRGTGEKRNQGSKFDSLAAKEKTLHYKSTPAQVENGAGKAYCPCVGMPCEVSGCNDLVTSRHAAEKHAERVEIIRTRIKNRKKHRGPSQE